MFDTTLRQMLAMHPKGATNDQIIWRLRSSGIRVDAGELLSGLTRLAERGEVISELGGRWKLAEFTKRGNSTGSKPATTARPDGGELSDILIAADASNRQISQIAETDSADQIRTGLPEWSSLLGYYAATQRHDPRGQIEEFRERHGQNWHLFRTSGRWWSGSELRLRTDALPAAFRMGLVRRKTNAAALGWPISVFHGSSGPSFVPGLIIPADWRFEGDELVLAVEVSLPALNPEWMRAVRAHTPWSAAALEETLFPEGEEVDLAAVGERMKHALATLGAVALRPGELNGEVSISGNGIRNAAGIFLPDDGSFTKGTAEDLEALRDWGADKRVWTALSALIECRTANASLSDVVETPTPLLALNNLTPSQTNAAEAALSEQVTVIQGPPGTGKSQVILSLLISAVTSGRTVLFAAKNHQAVDEVERRLKVLIGDAPLFVRARDADGGRDVSFLDALGDIARGESWKGQSDNDPRSDIRMLISRAEELTDKRRKTIELQKLHVTACDLAERLALFQKYGASEAPVEAAPSKIVVRLLTWLKKIFGLRWFDTGDLPENATRHQVARRLAAIREKIGSNAEPDDDQAAAENLAKDVTNFLPKLAQRITTPDEGDRIFAAERVKEIEFEKTKSVRRMRVEDAMLVLRHRPIWAISTLSVPSRVPLAPCLFDYVIFDESSQCDIASALPLMARARQAIIVGDPLQLRFVPSLGKAAEHALMDAAGFPKNGRASLAQSVNSLFDFTEHRPVAKRMFLADQFRSAPAIVDYLNSDFYGGRLINRKEDEDFKAPAKYKPGLTWQNVSGLATRRDSGNANKAEAEHIARQICLLAQDLVFEGVVGVISPFNAQVAEIQVAITAVVPEEASRKLSLRVATVDKWQGAECDVVFFSLVLTAGSPMSARTFLQKERRRLNVAVSRARAVCVVVGDLSYAKRCGIKHIEYLATRATTPWSPPKLGLFDSEWERRLDTAMRARGLRPMPQYPVGTRYLDFALEMNGRWFDIEVDGRRWHTDASGNRKVADILRDREMQARGWKVLRYWVHQLATDMESCVDHIERELRSA